MKKILILSCQGGGGHISAAQAITAILDNYQTKTVDLIGKELAHLDPIYWITGRHYTGQDFYNFLLQRNKKRLVNFFFHIGCFLIKLSNRRVINELEIFFRQENPQLIISVIPLFNYHIVIAANRLHIPIIIIPTDLDLKTFVNNLPLPPLSSTTIAISYNDPDMNARINPAITQNYPIVSIGFPVKPGFLVAKDNYYVRQRLHIPQIPVILLIMGAAGSISLIEFVKTLGKAQQSFHIIVCVGRAHKLKKKILKIKMPDHISVSIADEHQDISDLMSIADICITKPGSVTFNENIYMKVPMLLDNTTATLIWERLNIKFLQKHKLGYVINSFDEVAPLVDKLLGNPHLLQSIKYNFSMFDKKKITEELPALVQNILK